MIEIAKGGRAVDAEDKSREFVVDQVTYLVAHASVPHFFMQSREKVKMKTTAFQNMLLYFLHLHT